MRARLGLALALLAAGCSPSARQLTQTWPPPPDQMSPTIAAALASRPELATLAGAVRAAGLDTTLGGPGRYTLFAPTDAAFARLASGTVSDLERPENRRSLAALIGYWIVPGALTIADLRARVAAGGGRAALATVEGEPLTATLAGDAIELTDARGDRSYVEAADGRGSDGLIHVVNGVLVPAALG